MFKCEVGHVGLVVLRGVGEVLGRAGGVFVAGAARATASVAFGRDGGGADVGGPSVSGLAMRPGTIMNEGNNVDIQKSDSIGTAGEYLAHPQQRDIRARPAGSGDDPRLTDRERARHTVRSTVGPIGVWNAQVNRAAEVQPEMAGRAAIESTLMLDAAARIKLGGAEESIAKVRAAGLQAAE